jgi:outer membrane protein assembly factor BamE (lipoprotein component of BamABCDE complex)
MKTVNVLLGFVAAAILAATGCSKSDKTSIAPQMNGVTVDIPKLDQSFVNASPELRSTEAQVGVNIRYGKYEDALMVLDKLANDPNVTEDQKKVVNELIDATKKLAGAAPAAAPAQ